MALTVVVVVVVEACSIAAYLMAGKMQARARTRCSCKGPPTTDSLLRAEPHLVKALITFKTVPKIESLKSEPVGDTSDPNPITARGSWS